VVGLKEVPVKEIKLRQTLTCDIAGGKRWTSSPSLWGILGVEYVI
jgi:hypothetical protein